MGCARAASCCQPPSASLRATALPMPLPPPVISTTLRVTPSPSAAASSVVALGTSLPELATTVVAAFQRHSDLALGNVIGSNLFNILAIMGLAALLAPAPIAVPPGFLGFDLLVMLAATGILFFFAWRGGSIGRGDGLALLAAYLLYLGTIFNTPTPLTAMLSLP